MWIKKFIKRRWRRILVLAALTGIWTTMAFTPPIAALIRQLPPLIMLIKHALYQDVTITATPIWGSMPVTDFQCTETSGVVTCTWTASPTGVATLIRAKYASAVLSETDGYEVYYGAGTACVDTGVYTDETISDIYYAAYAVDISNNFSVPATDILESAAMAALNTTISELIMLLIIAGIVGLAYWRGIPILKVLGGFTAMAFGIYLIPSHTGFIYIMVGVVIAVIGSFMIISATGVFDRR